MNLMPTIAYLLLVVSVKLFVTRAGEYARDEDGDGFCEVHCNTMEGIWVGLRNFLRPFRGIHKKYLHLYVGMFEWSYNLCWIDFDFLRRLLMPPSTYLPR
jgi:transposase-like protein